MSRVPSLVFFVASLSALAVACGARGPLDIGDEPLLGADGGLPSIDASVPVDGAANDASAPKEDANPPPPPVDAGFTFDSGIPIVNCAACVFQSCGQDAIACLTDTGCRTTLQCAATMCLAGGTPDPTCLFTCGQSDPSSVPDVINLFECIVTGCGADCTSVLSGGGLPGLGGGGDAGGAGGGGGRGNRDGG